MLHEDKAGREGLSERVHVADKLVDVSTETLQTVEQLYDDGLYLQAYRHALLTGPLDRWKGSVAQVLAGRLVLNLGNHRLGRILHQWAYRQSPHDAQTSYYYLYSRLDRQGPLEAWQMMHRMGNWPDADPELRSDWLSLQGQIASFFRDHDSVDKLLKQAEELSPIRPWFCVVKSGVLQNADRYDEALEWVDRGLAIKRWQRSCVMQRAVLLRLMDREEEAEAFLLEAGKHIECGTIYALLAHMHNDKAQFDARFNRTTREFLDQYIALSPLLDRHEKRWVAAMQSDLAYLEGDVATFLACAKDSKSKFLEEVIGPRLAAGGEGKRVLLDVPYVRQHRSTCAPATLTSLAKFWKRTDVEHLRLAAIICYDGTPDHAERHWAETNGWLAREFTVTWDSTIALIDRGIPFTLTTIEPGAGHLQAVIGYDARRGTIITRDPSTPHVGEMDHVEGLKRYAAFGPRGMALLPLEEAARLDHLVLPDEDRYTAVYHLQRFLEKHDRGAAQREFESLVQQGPEHRLVHWARRLLANYDDDQVSAFAANDALLKLSPDNTTLRLAHLSSMVGLARRSERLENLRSYSNATDADPIFGQMLASELSIDAREQELAKRLLRRAIRTRPMIASSYITLADLHWGLMKRAEALELYRIASCLDDKVESYARSYFNAAVYLGRTDNAITWLRSRLAPTLSQSSQPARTLFWAYDRLNLSTEAFQALDQALAARPEDAELKLFAADSWLQRGEIERAQGLINVAKEKASKTRWLRSQAFLEDCRGDPRAALACWESILEIEPLSADAHRTATRLRAEIDGKTTALAELQRLTERYPHHYGLQALRIEWLRDDTTQLEKAVCQFLEHFPDDSWAHRELSGCLCDQNMLPEALMAAEQAVRLDPYNPASLAFRARIKAKQGKPDEASADYLSAIKLDIDYFVALHQYVLLGPSRPDRQQRLRSVVEELHRQYTQGDGISNFQEAAGDNMDMLDVLAELRDIWNKRQDLWVAWSCYASQLLETAAQTNHEDADHQRYYDQALHVSRQATERFPLLPAAWADLARMYRFKKDDSSEIEALKEARKLNPNWGQATRQLADAYERQQELTEAEECLKEAVARSTLDPVNHAKLGDFLCKHDRKEEAVACYRTAVFHSPGYEYAWDALRQLAVDLKQDDLASNIARELSERRPREARSWLFLADTLSKPEQIEEKLKALDRALELNPTFSDIYDKKAEALAIAGRFDEAMSVCRPAVTLSSIQQLEGRLAWVLWQKGEHEDAIKAMEKLFAEDEGYFWAAHQLVQWYRGDDRQAENYAKWAAQVTKIAPKYPVGFGHLGDALLKAGDRSGAKGAYRRALQLDPEYSYAGIALFDEQFADQEWDEAGETLEALDKNGPNAFVDARWIQLSCKSKRFKSLTTAIKKLECICTTCPEDNTWPLHTAIEHMWDAEWKAAIKNTLSDVLPNEKAHPLAANMLLRVICLEDGLPTANEKLLEILKDHPRYEEPAYRGIFYFLETKRSHTLNERFILRHEDRLRSNTELWGATAGVYAMDERAGYQAAHDWLSSYRSHSDGKPWMLMNYVTSSVALGKWDEAEQASRHALTWEADNSTNYHRVWLALHAVLRNDLDLAEQELSACDRERLDVLHGYLADAVMASIGVLRGSVSWQEYDSMLEKTAQTHQPVTQDRPALRAARKKLVQHVARVRFGWKAWFKASSTLSNRTMPPSGRVGQQTVSSSGSSSGGWSPGWAVFVGLILIINLARMGCSSSQQNRDYLPSPLPTYSLPSDRTRSFEIPPAEDNKLRKEIEKLREYMKSKDKTSQ